MSHNAGFPYHNLMHTYGLDMWRQGYSDAMRLMQPSSSNSAPISQPPENTQPFPAPLFTTPNVIIDHFSATPPQDWTVPHEYILAVPRTFNYENVDELAYRRLTEDQRAVVLERVHQLRPYPIDSVRRKIMQRMDVAAALDLLSGDIRRVEAAVEGIYPIAAHKKGYPITWMNGLSNAQRRLVIQKMAEATQQGTDKLLNLFLDRKITPGVAWDILRSPFAGCKAIANTHDLITPDDESRANWQRGLSTVQRKAVIQRMMLFSNGMKKKPGCYHMLQKQKVPVGLGLRMLRVDDEDFSIIMNFLSKSNAELPPHLM
ncbi:hypothetical protein CBS101457_000217 [Exobasidium rhododendri]|nr:hypothetical protein CBS101457_000217 [Exobasidium rhododendri]